MSAAIDFVRRYRPVSEGGLTKSRSRYQKRKQARQGTDSVKPKDIASPSFSTSLTFVLRARAVAPNRGLHFVLDKRLNSRA